MRTLRTVFAMVALSGLLVFSGGVLAAKPDGAGGGGGGVGGGSIEPPDYGDLIIILRDAHGIPVLSPADGDTGLCWQPIAFLSDLCPLRCVLSGIFDVDQATCPVADDCAPCTQEVDFGRINEARSPEDVFQAQLDDVIFNLATADCVTLDPAGRQVASRVVGEDIVTSSIDSPLQNLAIHRQLMMNGDLGVDLPDENILVTAARALGAASDKSGGVNVDMIAYLNQIMGLTELEGTTVTVLKKICIDMREEVMGVFGTANHKNT